jgi:transposase
MPGIAEQAGPVTGGVDTHAGVHVAAVAGRVGRVLGTQAFPATAAGYRAALAWMSAHGELAKAGVEGTGSYGAGLAALSGEASGRPTSRDGAAESIRGLKVARAGAIKARTPGRQPASRPDPHRTRATAPATGRAALRAAGRRGGPIPARRPGLPGRGRHGGDGQPSPPPPAADRGDHPA